MNNSTNLVTKHLHSKHFWELHFSVFSGWMKFSEMFGMKMFVTTLMLLFIIKLIFPKGLPITHTWIHTCIHIADCFFLQCMKSSTRCSRYRVTATHLPLVLQNHPNQVCIKWKRNTASLSLTLPPTVCVYITPKCSTSQTFSLSQTLQTLLNTHHLNSKLIKNIYLAISVLHLFTPF